MTCQLLIYYYYWRLRYKTPVRASSQLNIHLPLSLPLLIMIPRSARRPTRRQSRNLLGSMSLAFFAVLALVLLCPVAVNANEDKRPDYGTVIGIGE